MWSALPRRYEPLAFNPAGSCSFTPLSAIGAGLPAGADTVIDALLAAVGPEGTLCIPTLSYLFVNAEHPLFDVRATPTNLGAIPTAFLRRAGVVRSVHPTHSVAALGPAAATVTGSHILDNTPVGPHSSFRAVRDLGGQVAFLGCGTRCNTSIHGVEELLASPPPYLFKAGTTEYRVRDASGAESTAVHRRHGCDCTGQRYERVVDLMPNTAVSSGPVGQATMVVLEATAMWAAALAALEADPLCLVDHVPAGEGHFLKEGSDGSWRYEVRPVV